MGTVLAMLQLSTRDIKRTGDFPDGDIVRRITVDKQLPLAARAKHILLSKDGVVDNVDGFAAVFVFPEHGQCASSANNPVFVIPDSQRYLEDGDVVVFDGGRPRLHTLYRRNSKQNSLLITERCNNFCLMCSQPPKPADDSYILDNLMEAIPLMDPGTKEIGITGGEPTLLADRFIELIRTIRNYLPDTALHVLTNGRRFSMHEVAAQVAELKHPDLMLGIPVYSDIPAIHDYVVQGDGAFDETIRGIINLKRYRQKVEIRVVIHKQTYSRLPQLADFIARNLTFVDHVALMGLEMMGFTKINLEDLWIDPVDYQRELVEATDTLARYRIPTSVYNHQLCILNERLLPFYRKSISDWKNEYMPECEGCERRSECGGFFASAKLRYSAHIKPFLTEQIASRKVCDDDKSAEL